MINSTVVAGIAGGVLGYVGWPTVLLLTGPWARHLTRAWHGKAPVLEALTHILVFVVLAGLMVGGLGLVPHLAGAETESVRQVQGVAVISSLAGLFMFLLVAKLEVSLRSRGGAKPR